MEKIWINELKNSKYIALITVMHYEIYLSKFLKQVTFEFSVNDERLILLDTALKTGISKYRFVEFIVDSTGKINVDNYKYVLPDPVLEYKANKLLNQKKEIVKHSMLTNSEKEYIINLQ